MRNKRIRNIPRAFYTLAPIKKQNPDFTIGVLLRVGEEWNGLTVVVFLAIRAAVFAAISETVITLLFCSASGMADCVSFRAPTRVPAGEDERKKLRKTSDNHRTLQEDQSTKSIISVS